MLVKLVRRRILMGLAICACLAALVLAVAGEALSRAASARVGPAPADLHASDIRLPTNATDSVTGWFARGSPGAGAVLLLHGVRSDRRQMIGRARFLQRAGYAVMLIDLPAHGESSGDRITFGLREAEGVKAALGFLRRELPGERIGVIGVSLGAASLVLSKVVPAPSAVVLESMYPTIAEAVSDRLVMRLGAVGAEVAPLLLWQLPLRLGITADQLRPIAEIPALDAPVLIVSGTLDGHTTLAEARRLFEAAREPKEFWPVDGAAHVDLHEYAELPYEARILRFLDRYLRKPSCSRSERVNGC